MQICLKLLETNAGVIIVTLSLKQSVDEGHSNKNLSAPEQFSIQYSSKLLLKNVSNYKTH